MRSVSAPVLSYPALKYGSEVLIPARATPRGGVENVCGRDGGRVWSVQAPRRPT